MLVLVDGFTPVEVPIQAQGASTLKDDPVLHVENSPPDELKPAVEPLVCATESGSAAAVPAQTSFRLPSDVLFAFGSATLSPAAAGAIDALTKQVTATAGTVTIAGYTDAIGGDADNQRLSEARAAAVQQAITAKLGPNFTYKAVGFGKTNPVAPNTNPDGSDNPDGRARNRRVELTIDAAAGSTPVPPPASEAPNTSLDGTSLVPQVRSVTAVLGFTLAQVAIHNSGSADKALGYLNDPNRTGPDGIRADTGGELSLTTATGGRLRTAAAVRVHAVLVGIACQRHRRRHSARRRHARAVGAVRTAARQPDVDERRGRRLRQGVAGAGHIRLSALRARTST
jgi:outer membrane protein OmpA-like peptidoglycan-associated protein